MIGGGEMGQFLGPVIANALNMQLAKDPAVRELEAGIAADRDKLIALVNKAKEAGGGGEMGLLDWMRSIRPAADEESEEAKRFREHGMKGMQRAFDEIKGTFNTASARGQFGYGSKVSEETEIQKAIRLNTQKTAEELAKLVMALQLR